MHKMKFLHVAAAATALLLAAGCSDKSGGNDTPSVPSIKTSAGIHFVGRLSDATLFSSESDASAVEEYVNTVMGGDDATLMILDRTDMSGVARTAEIALNTHTWTSFVPLGQTGADAFDVSTVVFSAPSRLVSSYEIVQGSFASGITSEVSGTVTNYDSEGNVTRTNKVMVDVSLLACRFDDEAQIKAFCDPSGTLASIKAADREAVIVATVDNGLLESLKSSVPSADSSYFVAEASEGTGYTLVVIAASRYWAFNGCSQTGISGGISDYVVDIAWK